MRYTIPFVQNSAYIIIDLPSLIPNQWQMTIPSHVNDNKHITISYSLFYSQHSLLFPKTCPKPFHPHPLSSLPFPPTICLHRSILIQNGPNEGRPLTQTELLQFQPACVRPTLHQCPPPSLLRDPTYRSPVWCLFTRVTDPWGVGQAQEKHPFRTVLIANSSVY
jgi:hypothetical protein